MCSSGRQIANIVMMELTRSSRQKIQHLRGRQMKKASAIADLSFGYFVKYKLPVVISSFFAEISRVDWFNANQFFLLFFFGSVRHSWLYGVSGCLVLVKYLASQGAFEKAIFWLKIEVCKACNTSCQELELLSARCDKKYSARITSEVVT